MKSNDQKYVLFYEIFEAKFRPLLSDFKDKSLEFQIRQDQISYTEDDFKDENVETMQRPQIIQQNK